MAQPLKGLPVGRLYPKFTATFYTENGEKIINGRQSNSSAQAMAPYLNAGLSSFTSKNDSNDDMPAFSISLISGSVFGSIENWGDIIKPNDYVKLDVQYVNTLAPVSGEKFDNRVTLMAGLVSQVTRSADYENDTVSYTISCQGVAKILSNANLGTFSELTSNSPSYALLEDDQERGIAFQGKSSRNVISEVLDRFLFSQKNYLRYTYLMDGGKEVSASTIFTPFIYDEKDPTKEEAGNPDEKMLGRPSKYLNYNGSLLSMINDLSAKPFNELYWTHEEGKATLHYRITPFDRERWDKLASVTIDNSTIMGTDFTNTDQDQYSVFRLVTGVDALNLSNVFSFLYPLTSTNLIRRYGYKLMEVTNDYFNPDIAPDSSDDSNSSGGTSDIPSSVAEFVKKPLNTSFGCDFNKVVNAMKSSEKARSRLGGSTENIKRLLKIVKENGVSPELFVAHELAEGGNLWGWWNATYYVGDPYKDAVSVCKWAKETANVAGTPKLAFYDQAFQDRYTTPASIQSKATKSASALPKGSIGRMYLQGSAAATWALYDPKALKGSVNGVQDYGNPFEQCLDYFKQWK